jgi:hypothetical protein
VAEGAATAERRASRLLPARLERSRHQAVLGLHRVILPLGPLGLVPGALNLQPPLLVEALALPLGEAILRKIHILSPWWTGSASSG